MDPFLEAMGLAVTRACADDVGAALLRIEALSEYHKIFTVAEAVAGLILRGKKCTLVPVGGPFRAQLVALVRDWLMLCTTDLEQFPNRRQGEVPGLLAWTSRHDRVL